MSEELLKLNLGCWKRNIPGFTNVDICNLPHVDYKSKVDDLSFLDDNSAELIYASHVFEYYDMHEVRKVLEEWSRVLIKGGLLRIAVPDFEKLIKVYEKTEDLGKIIGPLYGRMEIETKNGKELIYHKTVFDYKSLKKLLLENCFSDVKKYDWRNTIHADYDDHSQAYFPHMDKDKGFLISLNVEAKNDKQ